MAAQFECVFCSEAKSDRPHMVDVYPICTQCSKEQIVPLFERAATQEFHYPPRWGSTLIEISNFSDLMSLDFLIHYQLREEEYKTNIKERIYCPHTYIVSEEGDSHPINVLDVVATGDMMTKRCNTFLGSKHSTQDVNNRLCCSECFALVCGCCGEALTDPQSHECKLRAEDEVDEAFDGLTRGVVWQACPHCGTKVQLAEACNEITCKLCSGHFCHLCGEATPVTGETAHWRPGGCRRWGTGPRETATLEDFDRPPVQLPFSPEQYQEAYSNAERDEDMFPSDIPEDAFPPNIERNLRIIVDRDEIQAIVEELRRSLTLDIEQNFVWKYETMRLLSCVAESLDLILIVTHAQRTTFPHFLEALENIQEEIIGRRPYVPLPWLHQHPQMPNIVAHVMEQLEFWISNLQ